MVIDCHEGDIFEVCFGDIVLKVHSTALEVYVIELPKPGFNDEEPVKEGKYCFAYIILCMVV